MKNLKWKLVGLVVVAGVIYIVNPIVYREETCVENRKCVTSYTLQGSFRGCAKDGTCDPRLTLEDSDIWTALKCDTGKLETRKGEEGDFEFRCTKGLIGVE